jgi:acetoacetyl-CoA synthetase
MSQNPAATTIPPATTPGTLLTPAPERSDWKNFRMGRFLESVEAKTGRRFETYEDAWAWSVENLEDFWQEVWDHFEVISHSPHTAVFAERTMPGAQWFPGATLNYAEHVFRSLRARSQDIMVTSRSQTNGSIEWTGARLLEEVARIQAGLVARGVTRGDRVAAYLPNIPETLAAYLATTALGAIWCAVPPEMGPQSVLDRLTQLEPSILLAIDGYVYGKRELSRADDLARIRRFLPQARTVLLPYLDPQAQAPEGAETWAEFTGRTGPDGGTAAASGTAPADVGNLPGIHVEPVPFDHPLTVLFSSGTTGKPKAIVHCHGGILLEHLKAHGLQYGMSEADNAFWFTTTGWMVWTMGMSSLLLGASVVLMDGDPNYPSLDGEWSQWAVVAETKATYMGTGSAYLGACAHAGLTPGKLWDLTRLREVQCSGSPLAADVAGWIMAEVNPHLLLAPTSGGTDICAAFVGGSPLTAVWAGEMSCRPLGVAVESWDPAGQPLHGEAGELVCTQPMPSMPAFFWGDEDNERYLGSYFGAYEGVWRHGDWLVHTERGSWVITGRSDATLNRGGVRLGTAEFYAVLDALPQVNDTMVLHFEDSTGMGKLVLLVDAAEDVAAGAGTEGGAGVDQASLEKSIRTTLRSELSPRHVPDYVVFVPSIPRNPTGKRLEIPLKRIIQGAVRGEVMDMGVVARPEQVDDTVARVKAALGRD